MKKTRLCMTVKEGRSIVIGDKEIEIVFRDCRMRSAKITVIAPPEVRVVRKEIKKNEEQESAK